MNKLEAFKLGAGLITGLGAMKIVSETTSAFVLRRNVIEKVAVTSAQFVLGLLVAETASKFIDRKTDDVIAWLDQSAKKNAETE